MKHDKVDSSTIKSIGYDSMAKLMEINFHKSGIYMVHNIPKEEYDNLMQAESQGKYFHQNIKNYYHIEKKDNT